MITMYHTIYDYDLIILLTEYVITNNNVICAKGWHDRNNVVKVLSPTYDIANRIHGNEVVCGGHDCITTL